MPTDLQTKTDEVLDALYLERNLITYWLLILESQSPDSDEIPVLNKREDEIEDAISLISQSH